MSTLTIATLNTYLCRVFGFDLCPQPGRRAQLIHDELQRIDPDVVCLQEVWDSALAALVMRALPAHEVIRYDTQCWYRPMGTGLMIASRLPVRRVSFQPIVSTWRPKEILAQRGLLTTVLESTGTELAVTSTHLGVGMGFMRRRQHRAFLTAIESFDGPHIVCGDFNVSTCETERQRFPALGTLSQIGFRDVVAEAYGPNAEAMVTVDRNNAMVRKDKHRRIDYIWVKSAAAAGWRVCDANVIFNTSTDGVYPSDHYGVFARLMFMPQMGH